MESQQLQESSKQNKEQLFHKVIYRWYALTLICLIACGGYFCYDLPACLEYVIMNIYDVDVTTYSLLYSVYSFPNMVMPLYGGKIIDKLGKGNGLIITSLILTCG